MEHIKIELKEIKREFIGNCPKCGEEIFHVVLSNGDEYTTDNCECKNDEMTMKELEAMSNNKDLIIQLNKEHCNFTKRDISEISKHIKIHSGNIEAYNRLIEYANKFNNETSLGFYIHGETGVGKSLLAKKVMLMVLNKGYSAYITNVIELMKNIKSEMSDNKNDTLKLCQDVDLLVIDDLGTERVTDYDKEQMYFIVNGRYNNNKPVIYTSNCKLEDLFDKYDNFGRIYSRISGSVEVLEIEGNDFRLQSKE